MLEQKDSRKYGIELVMDLHNCDPDTFTREKIGQYFVELCDLIDMQRADLHWWDDLDLPDEERETEPHLKGTSAIQFITTSNITIHTLDLLKAVYVNLFSCKSFDPEVAKKFTENWFKGEIVNSHVIDRI
ncbi:S-adenosylmethionine decarboxylase [Candidatus Kaiserbacteria bacterium]|nr:S-adenosylmethionine decarboxylase [Candidatus Kaiserbacteria bacterium]